MNTPDTRCTNPKCTNKRCVGCIAFAPKDTPDTEWEKELEQHAPNLTFKSLDNGVNTISMVWLKSFIRTTLTSRDTYWKERVEEARKEAYAHAEIVRQRTLNDIREAVEADVPYGGAKDCVYVILDNLK